MLIRSLVCHGLCTLLLGLATSIGAEPAADPAGGESGSVLAGHSYHGEAFNEGPRQAAVLMPGMAKTVFPTSTKSALAQQFVEQGIAQLHGFWYLEAERSFRQAAKEDPQLAIAYWGMAMANLNNAQRARGFIDEAVQRSSKDTSRREKLYIEALDRFTPKPTPESERQDKPADGDEKKKRAEQYLGDLEKILDEFPDDIEAKAFLAVQMWMADRDGVKLTSRYALDALLGEIFAVDPTHSAHHYRIHLWDSSRPQNAVESAAKCGPASPGIAHMWHMPGHTYSKLKRYGDAAWQQEASARVDHAHMIRTQLMPDEIHNFAHNNEWLVRNLIYIGRVQDALDLSRNLISLPCHPRYNSQSERGSHSFGRQRLLQTLTEYALWDELLREAGGPYLAPTDDAELQEDWLGWLAVAQFRTGDRQQGGKTLRSLQRRRLALQGQLLDGQEEQAEDQTGGDGDGRGAAADSDAADSKPDEVEAEKPEEIKKHLERLRQVIARAAAAAAIEAKDVERLKRHMNTAKLDTLIQSQWLADAGELDEAIKLANKAVKEDEQQVRPLAVLVDLHWRKDRQKEAIEQFQILRQVAAVADLDTPMLARLAPVAEAAGVQGDWRIASTPAEDLGSRPPLDELGPFRWQPYTSPSWGAKSPAGELVSGDEYAGRPRIVIFYLGFGCLHCVEQLNEFSPRLEEFRSAGIELLAISSETIEQLQTGIQNFDGKIELPLLSDEGQDVFRAFRCWDDFEHQPLHGTFLIDSRDRVRWQDIGHEPFTDAGFLLEEAQRLLAMPQP
jgi:peroxiredoxin/tetratricopeptide (TPR) repeat protein